MCHLGRRCRSLPGARFFQEGPLPIGRVVGPVAPGLEGRHGVVGGARGLPGLGPPREPGRRGFAEGRHDVAPLQAGEPPALLDQLQELRQGHRSRG